ncbi:hypothetical protein V8C26DRAFT_400653 [Trichoderma gracile]
MHSRLFLVISPAQTSYFHFSCGLILRLYDLPSCTGTLAWSQLNDSHDALPTKTCSSWHKVPSTRYGRLCVS